MKKTSKKGFTMVELVIVIAVIAILAAVLIPTFVNLIKKANESLDIQIVRQMNQALQTEEITSGKPATVVDAKQILIANGCDDFTPSDSENVFYWYITDNRVVLWNTKESAVLFPKEYTDIKTIDASFFDLSQEYAVVTEVVPTEGQSLKDALIVAARNAQNGDILRLPAGATAEMQQGGFYDLSAAIGSKQLTIDMNGSTFTSSGTNALFVKENGSYKQDDDGYVQNRFYVCDGGNLTLVNGKFEVNHGALKNVGVTTIFQVNAGATLILNDIEINTENMAVFPASTAGEVVISNCKINAGYYALMTNGQSSHGVRITINNSELKADTCVLVNTQSGIFINDSTLTGEVHALVVRSGYASVKNSTLITTDNNPGVFSYKDFASGVEGFSGGFWQDGNKFPAATIVAGDYSTLNSKNEYPYKGNVTVYLQNVKLQSADETKVPHVLVAASDPEKTVELIYDSASIVNVLKRYGEDWCGTNQNVGVTIDNKGTIIVNGNKKN